MRLLFVIIISLTVNVTFAQKISHFALNPVFLGNANIISTAGGLATTTEKNQNWILTQDFLQPFFLKNSPFEKDTLQEFNLSVYPNPFTDFLNLTINFDALNQVQIRLFDSQGRNAFAKKFNFDGRQTFTYKLNLNGFSDDVYFLQVVVNQQIIKNYKLIKTTK